jgi:transitional endoplasmic reticulum ATPase
MDIFDDDSFPESAQSDRGRRFQVIELPTALAREGALYALRMIEGQRWHRRLFDRNGIRDRDLLTLVGLAENSKLQGNASLSEFQEACQCQLRRMESRVRIGKDLLSRNVAKLGELLKLSPTEIGLLRAAVVATRASYFADMLNLAVTTGSELLRGMRHATGCKADPLRRALGEESRLRRSGIFASSTRMFGVANPIEVNDEIVTGLLSPGFNQERLIRHLTRVSPRPKLSLIDFSHLPDLDLLKRYLANTLSCRRKGANILIYGAPGTGKTEFVRALAAEISANLNEVPNTDAEGEPVSGQERFRAFSVCQAILAGRKRQILLFDEVEDVFGSADESLSTLFPSLRGGSLNRDEPRKSWVNETLESNPVPSVWVCNKTSGIDPAFVRRFDLIVEFRPPTRSIRRRIVDSYFRNGEISDPCADRIANMEALSPSHVERAARVVRTLRTRNLSERDAQVERALRSSLRVMGVRDTSSSLVLPEHYDLAFLNPDQNLDHIIAGLKTSRYARLCLYGPPGTGKTAFAHHIAREVEQPLLVRRASDLLDPYVGGTESRLRDTFEQARDENALLLIDEADSFLRDRAGAHQQWEVTQVNELLTQMESFNGNFIASTNLFDTLDAASLRRFDFKVKFDYLTREQRRAMLDRVALADKRTSPEWQSALEEIDRLQLLTPGDFTSVLRQLSVAGEPLFPLIIVKWLSREIAVKRGGRTKPIGFLHSAR